MRYRGKRKLCLLVLVFGLMVWMHVPMLAAKSVNSKGAAVITGEDIAQARDQAINDAVRKAVEMAVGSQIQTESLMKNYELLEEQIYSKSSGYVSNYKVIEEKRESNLYWVTISAEVSEGQLKDDLAGLGLLMSKKKMPRIMVLVGEQNMGFYSWNVYWNSINQSETVLIEKLRERDFKVVDSNTVKRQADKDAALKAFEGDDKAAAVIARKLGAEVIIAGNAVAEAGDTIAGSNMHSCNADVSVRAIRADTGEIIATASKHAVKPHISTQSGNNEALRAAAEEVANELIDQIIERWQQDVYQTNAASIFIVSADAAEVQDFKEFLLTQVRGVSAVYIRDLSGQSATLDLELKGDAEDLGAQLVRKKFKDKTISIVEQSLNKLSIRFDK
ncbi:flagellar assembly protein T N-terminal domain-containing protein [bacterium]|nr:flagellar assembly protein T N-terminal domain-containing protein [bacterium]